LEDTKVFDAYFELPDGYQIQLMVLQDFPGGRPRRGLRMNIFRSRIWIGHVSESEPLVYRSQEHSDLNVAVDGCYSMLLVAARFAVNSPVALEALQAKVHRYFGGARQQDSTTQAI
jgi:hypothetical protein